VAAIRGTIRNGKVEFDSPPAWPEGAEVLVVDSVIPSAPDEPFRMLTEEEQGDDPESIVRWLAAYDALEPLILTPDDEARIRAARDEQRAFELAQWEAHSKKLERDFQ
jgi:hypothetical protein